MDDKTLYDLFGSLSREIAAVRQDLKDGFDRVESRVARHGGLLIGGSRQITRLIKWSEEMDEMLIERDARIAELTSRIDKLERKNGA